MIPLIAKESDGIRPLWYAVIAFWIWFTLTHMLDPHGQAPRGEVLTDSLDDWAFSCALLCFFLGHSMVAREYRDGHIEFLDGLPIHRWQIFLAKVLAAILPLVTLIASTGITKWVVCWIAGAPHAIDPTHAIGVHLVLFSALTFGFLGLGFTASWIGGLGWGILFLALFLSLVISLEWAPLRPYMPITGIMEATWDGSRATQLWGPVFFWFGAGTVGFSLSGLLFLGPGRFFVRTGSWLLGGVRGLAVGCFTCIVMLVGFISVLGVLGQFSERLWVDTKTTQTEHFRWLYRTSAEDEALALIGEAEGINADLAEAMGNETPFFLDIEILSAARYHAGVYLGGKIRLADHTTAEVLAHELAHAHAYAICGWAAHHQSDHVRFFHEGLAEYYQQRVVPNPALDTRQLAAAIWKTEQARFDLLVEDKVRNFSHDMTQVYPLGREFVEVLVDVEGPEAPACILRALRDAGSEDIAGISLWYGMMRQCGYDLDRVIRAFDARLEHLASDLEELPSLTGQVVRVDGRVEALRVYDENDRGGTLMCRFRDDGDTTIADFEHRQVRPDGTCKIPQIHLAGQTFWFQLGFALGPDSDFVYREWTSAPL